LIEKTIREIKEDKKSVAEIKKDFNNEKNRIDKYIKDKKLEDRVDTSSVIFQIGDSVTAEDSNSSGYIIQIYDESKTALVDFNGIKFKIAQDQLKKSDHKKEKKKSSESYVSFDIKTSADVRGMRAHEAIPEVDELISNALMSSLDRITIIHGKGTGALRVAIQEYLKTHYSVKSFRSGTMLEGGDGVTVVEL
jgi:DNA mismatch repair protein MutS2